MNPALARFLAPLGVLRSDHLRILVPSGRVRIETPLLVECVGGIRSPIKFIIDSGCSVTTLSLDRAKAFGLPTQGRRVPKPRTGSMGTRTITVIQSTFRFWLSADQRAVAFVAPVEFEENQPLGVPPLFGLKGIIDQLRWTIGPCKPPLPDVLGCCVLQDVRPAAQRFPS